MSFCHVPSPPSTYPFLEASQSVAYPSRHFVNAENRDRESVARKEEREKRACCKSGGSCEEEWSGGRKGQKYDEAEQQINDVSSTPVERAFSLDKQNNLMSSWSWSARLIKPDRVDGNAGRRGASGPVFASR